MSTLNVHLLDYLMTDNFLESNIYPQNAEAQTKVAGFISEFYILFKSLTLDVKNDITQNLKEKKVAPRSVKKIHQLLLQSREESKTIFDHESNKIGSPKILQLEMNSPEQMDMMEKIGEGQDTVLKNLICSHMEMLLIAIRKDKDYSFTVFKEFGKVDEFMELLLEFPDDSTLLLQVLILFRSI